MLSSGGIVLVGGRSSRMGRPKAALEWHGSTLLRRTCAIVARATEGPVVVVRAAGQELPPLPAEVEIIDDPRAGKGPLQGIAAGLAAVGDRAEVAFVCATDLPFLHPAYIQRVTGAIGAASAEAGAGPADVALPFARGFPQPLAAAYRTALAPLAGKLVAADRLRPSFLFDECSVLRLDEAALKTDPVLALLDPDLDSVRNVNDPADYRAARERPAPEVAVRRLGALAGGQAGPEPVRAATVAEAAAASRVDLGRNVMAAINDSQPATDWELPLVAGDTVFFSPVFDSPVFDSPVFDSTGDAGG